MPTPRRGLEGVSKINPRKNEGRSINMRNYREKIYF